MYAVHHIVGKPCQFSVFGKKELKPNLDRLYIVLEAASRLRRCLSKAVSDGKLKTFI